MLRIFTIACMGILIGFGSMAYAYRGDGASRGMNGAGPRADCPNIADCPRVQQPASTPATQPNTGTTCPDGDCGQQHRHGGNHGHGGHHGK